MESSNKRPVSGVVPRAEAVSNVHVAMTRLDALDRRLASEIAALQQLDARVALPHTCDRLVLLSATIELRAAIGLDPTGAGARSDAAAAVALITSYKVAIIDATETVAELLRQGHRTG